MFNQSLPKSAEGKVIIANRTEINVCLRISGIIEFYNFFGENGARRVGSMGGWQSSEPRESFRSPVQIKPRAHNVVAKQHCAKCICFVPLKVRMSLFRAADSVCRKAFSRDEKYLSLQPSWKSVLECVRVRVQKAGEFMSAFYIFSFSRVAWLES